MSRRRAREGTPPRRLHPARGDQHALPLVHGLFTGVPSAGREKERTAMIGSQDLVVGLVIVLVLFGAKRLPELAASLGKSMKECGDQENMANELDSASRSGYPV